MGAALQIERDDPYGEFEYPEGDAEAVAYLMQVRSQAQQIEQPGIKQNLGDESKVVAKDGVVIGLASQTETKKWPKTWID